MGMTSAWAVAALGVAGLVALPAHAEDADKLVADAEALVAKGDYEHACPKLREAAKAKPALETLAALADCDDRAGNKASAYQEYDELIPRAKAAYADDLAKKATERKAALAGELAKVVLVVPKTTRLTYTIELDGVVLSADRIGVELLLAAGKHHLKVTTNGAPDTQMDTDFEVPGNLARSTVTIPLDRPGEAIAPAAQTGNGQPAGQQTIIVQGRSGFGQPGEPQVPMKNNPGMIAGGSLLIVFGVVSIFTSAGFGVASIWNDDYGTAAWGFFIGGLIGVGAGIPIVVVGAIKHPVQDASAGRLQAAIPELRIGPGSVTAKWAF